VIKNPALIQARKSHAQGDLLLELEWARIQLAIAIAVESKSTPLERRQYYLDTADQVRRYVRRLRAAGGGTGAETENWHRTLESIRQMPNQCKASQLCQVLRDIVGELE
jgi:hypothetical protein